jgi:Xaa-Pro aminopeptidase
MERGERKMSQHGLKLGSGGMGTDYSTGFVDFGRMRRDRLEKAKKALARNGIPSALLFRQENIRYVTGMTFPAFIERLRYCLAFAEHEPLLAEAHGRPMADAPWIKTSQHRLALHWASQSPGKDAVYETARAFAEDIRNELKAKGLDKEKLGIDEIDEPGRQALVDAGLNLTNAMPTLLEARAVKTEDEINCFHMATVLCDAAHYSMYERMKPGMRERDVKAIGFDSLIRNGAEQIWDVLVSSGGQIGGISFDSDKFIQPGDVVTIDIAGATYMGYNSCYYRNYVVGRKPTQREKDLHKRSYERMYSVIDAIRPGASTADLADLWTSARSRGLPSENYTWCDDLAHGLGLWLYEYPICNRLWSIQHPMTIEKGMTMAVEAMEFDPMIGRTKLEEMIVVRENGAEILSRMPAKGIMVCNSIDMVEV